MTWLGLNALMTLFGGGGCGLQSDVTVKPVAAAAAQVLGLAGKLFEVADGLTCGRCPSISVFICFSRFSILDADVFDAFSCSSMTVILSAVSCIEIARAVMMVTRFAGTRTSPFSNWLFFFKKPHSWAIDMVSNRGTWSAVGGSTVLTSWLALLVMSMSCSLETGMVGPRFSTASVACLFACNASGRDPCGL